MSGKPATNLYKYIHTVSTTLSTSFNNVIIILEAAVALGCSLYYCEQRSQPRTRAALVAPHFTYFLKLLHLLRI